MHTKLHDKKEEKDYTKHLIILVLVSKLSP